MEMVFSGCPDDASIREWLPSLCRDVLEEEGVDSEFLEISVSFVNAEEVQQLNWDYRQRDRVTDVLSFPQYLCPGDIPRGQPALLGDVVICLDKIQSQARELGHSTRRELVYLFIHSLLHLLGYDHEVQGDKEKMRKREKEIMTKMEDRFND